MKATIVSGAMVSLLLGLLIATSSAFSARQTARRQRSTILGPTARNGLGYEDVTIGTGRRVFSGDTVELYYTGSFTKGTGPFAQPVVFDKTQEGEPFQFVVGKGELIEGCDLGILGDLSLEIPAMNIGGERKLKIPASLAYGAERVGPIPANQDLEFRIEVLSAEEQEGLSLSYQLKGYGIALGFVVTVISLVWLVLLNI